MNTTRETAHLGTAAETPTQRVSLWHQITMNLFWFANNVHWGVLMQIAIASMVATLLPFRDKGLNLALVIGPGTVIAFIVNPLVGGLSDYARFKMGRRRPFMIIGTVVNVIALLAMGLLGFMADGTRLSATVVLIGMIVLFMFIQFSNNFANAPWSAIIADQVPERQRGSASGFYGLMTLLGTAVGAVLAGTLIRTTAAPDQAPVNTLAFRQGVLLAFILVALIQVIFVTITVVSIKEQPLTQPRPFSWGVFLSRFKLESRKYPDFSWLLMTRVLIMTGIWAVNFMLVYYFTDVLSITGSGRGASAFGLTVESSQQAVEMFMVIVLVLAALTVYLSGWLSDRVGRKKLVYISGAVMTIVALIFIFAQSFPAALLAAAFFGIGFGAYTSVDWALATDVLPPTDEAGKHMGIWTAAGIIPQTLAVFLGGLLTFFMRNAPNHLGYTTLFAVTVLFFLLGTVFVAQVKGAR